MTKSALKDSKGQIDLAGIKAQNAILDSGASYALIPGSDFETITMALETGYGVKCREPEGEQTMTSVHNCDCGDFYDSLPSIGVNLVKKELAPAS